MAPDSNEGSLPEVRGEVEVVLIIGNWTFKYLVRIAGIDDMNSTLRGTGDIEINI